MKRIDKILERIVENASKAKFYRNNFNLFLKYFGSEEEFNALILAGNFDKLEKTISENSKFDFEQYQKSR